MANSQFHYFTIIVPKFGLKKCLSLASQEWAGS